MKVSGDGDAGDCSETTAGTPKLFVISRRRFLKATGATAALSPFVARAAVERFLFELLDPNIEPSLVMLDAAAATLMLLMAVIVFRILRRSLPAPAVQLA